MRLLSRYFRLQFSSHLRSAINIDLLKTESGVAQLRKSMQARFKSEQLLADLQRNYEGYRKSTFTKIETSTRLNCSTNRPTT